LYVRQAHKEENSICRQLTVRVLAQTSALISLFKDAVLPYLPPNDSPDLKIQIPLKYFVSLLQFATYFCLGLTIAIAFDVKQAINGSREARVKLHRSKEVRQQKAILAALATSTHFNCDAEPDLHLHAPRCEHTDIPTQHHPICHDTQRQLQPSNSHLKGKRSDKVHLDLGSVHVSV
jgi:hypothetical protein